MITTIHDNDIMQYKKLKLIGDIAPVREHLKLFETKYGMLLEEFEQQLKTADEDFEKWDDYIEWKAYSEKMIELKKALQSIENA